MFHLSSLHCWPFHFSFTFHKIIISAQRRFHNQVKPSLMSPRCITWTCGFVAQLIVAPNHYLGGRDWIPWKPEFLRLLFWNCWKLQLTCEHHSFTYMCIHQATVLVACPVFSNSNEQMVFCIHFSETHINKGHCRNINNKSASKRNEITFLKDAAPSWGRLYEGRHSKRITWYVSGYINRSG